MIIETSNLELRENRALDYFQNIVETVREPLVILDSDLRVTGASRSFYTTFKVTREETEGRFIYELGDRQWDIPELRTLLEEVLPERRQFDEFEVVHQFPGVGRRVTLLSARRIISQENQATTILLAIEDITDRKRTEERLRVVVEASPSAMVMMNEQGRITLVNTETEHLFGYERAELLNQPVEMLVPEGYRAAHPGHRQLFAQNPSTRTMGAGRDLFGLRKDGSEVPIEIGLNPIRTDEGAFVLASIIDITERKKDEQVLRESEERLRVVIEASPSAMVMMDEQGRITLVNTETEHLFGYERAELLNQPLEMLVPERYRAAHPGHRQLFAQNPYTRKMGAGRDLYGLRKDGSEVPIEIGLNPIRTDEGAFVLASIIDITSRKREEQVLRESEERLETIIENLHEGLVISDLDGQLTHFNQAGLVMHGFSSVAEGLLRLPQFHEMFELSTPDGPVLKFEEWPLARVMAGEVLTDYEVCLRRIDKDWQAIFSYGGSIVKAPNGQPLAFLAITDISKRKRTEERLRLYRGKLERSNGELQDFAQVASHDLQEPLRKILALGDRLKAKAGESLDGECRDYLQRMFNAAARMQTLIKDLMEFSRVETKGQPFVNADLGSIAREVSADLEARVEQAGGRIEIEALPTIEADPLQMRQLLQNLIGNSLKYYRPGVPPVVRIYSQNLDGAHERSIRDGAQSQRFCELSVTDNGIGFDEKYLDRIFTVFQRLHNKTEYEGTGIGLSICRKIVDRHRGTITARSSPGQGATFVVTLPVIQPKEVEVL